MIINPNEVYLIKQKNYDVSTIYNSLPRELFSIISPGNTVVLKPNWVLEEHQYRSGEWEQVITHPTIITAVLRRVVEKLKGHGHVIITDGPELDADFNKILSHQPLDEWEKITSEQNIILDILDLREEYHVQDKNVTIEIIKLEGDPKGKVTGNLIGENSEFWGHIKSKKGYFGATSDIGETNKAHDGYNNLYSISRSVVDADVFINLPKLKTHKKAGITCSLKNLVGINTHRNYLPHNSIGTPASGGDQFPSEKTKSLIESTLMPYIHQYILKNPVFGKIFSPVMGLGKKIFGDNRETIRGGSWYGNDTLWRMVIDINKVFFYVNNDGTFRASSPPQKKKYISIVDGIIAGEGNGPKAPDSILAGYMIAGLNPVAVDAVCARIMNFDPNKIPSIANAFKIRHFHLSEFNMNDVAIVCDSKKYSLDTIPNYLIINFKPHRGWEGHIEHGVKE